MLGAEKAIAEIVGGKGTNAIAERFQIGEIGRELRGCRGGNGWCQGGSGGGGSGMEKKAARDGSHDKEGWGGKGVVSRREKTYTENAEFTEKKEERKCKSERV